jgi:hypothetical protein
VPPARIEPVFASTRIFCMHCGLGRLKPLLPQVFPSGSVNVVTNCWSIWPTFSGNVITASSAFTRSDIDLPESSQAGDFPGSPAGPGEAWDGTPTPRQPTTNAPVMATAMRLVFRRWELIRNRRE